MTAGTGPERPCVPRGAPNDPSAAVDAQRPESGAQRRPRLLELFAGAQGAAVGYARAGFEVTATDLAPHDRHPEIASFFTANALDVLADHAYLASFDVVTGGPPCQAFTNAQKIRGNAHPNLIDPMRNHCQAAGVPYVIENVPGAPLRDPLELCGCMFPGLRTYRPRLFESSLPLPFMLHSPHTARVAKMGRPPKPGEFMHVVGNFSGVQAGREAMGIDWMRRDDLREAIPPAYTTWIGTQLLEALEVAA